MIGYLDSQYGATTLVRVQSVRTVGNRMYALLRGINFPCFNGSFICCVSYDYFENMRATVVPGFLFL
jgi:hypothetical protein